MGQIYEAILDYMSVVQIDVFDPTNGPKIFDSLNSRQEPMTVGDLVRNEVFSRVADKEAAEIEQIDQDFWQPFYQGFQVAEKNIFDTYFFPYGLIHNSNLSKSEVYGFLRDRWAKEGSPQKIIEELSQYRDVFVDISEGTHRVAYPKAVDKLMRSVHRMGAPASTFPFYMQLSDAVQNAVIDEKNAVEMLRTVESFLVRRAMGGIEPTGLHAVFKKLWSDCDGVYTAEAAANAIRKHPTVSWPNDEYFRDSVRTRPLYGSAIASYVIAEYDISLGGDVPSDIPWIEHVLPQTPVNEWFQSFTKDEHAQMVDVFANLIPLSSKMNQSLLNSVYAKKRQKYLDDAMFKSARNLARENQSWTRKSLLKRADALASWALKRWPD